jgi:hypothetical protein
MYVTIMETVVPNIEFFYIILMYLYLELYYFNDRVINGYNYEAT